MHIPKGGLFTTSAWEKKRGSIKIRTANTGVCRMRCGVPCAGWWTPASTQSTGRASRWSTSFRSGKEAGFYQDPYSEYGRLQNEMWRSVRWVVDTGVHAKHWTRQQMVAFFPIWKRSGVLSRSVQRIRAFAE